MSDEEPQNDQQEDSDAVEPAGVITTQPGIPPTALLPEEFECFRHSEYIRIKQKLEWMEICCRCCEHENQYHIVNHLGEAIFEVKEESWCCLRCCLCGAGRPMNLFMKKVTVYCPTAPEEVKLGRVQMVCSCVRPRFMIYDANDEPQLQVVGPCAPCNMHRQKTSCAALCCGQATFNIYRVNNRPDAVQHKDADGEMQYKDGDKAGDKVGEMRKEAAALVKEFMTDADNFTLTFEPELELNLKLLLLALVILVDFLYYEKEALDKPKLGAES